MTEPGRSRAREVAIIALVSGGHFWSHFFTLAIPAALPLIREDFGASNVSLGLVMAAFALMSAGWQFPMGIITDRHGARALLIGGLAIESLAMMSQSAAPAVPVMIAIAVVMGIADSVFHPADYIILTARVRPQWLGRAYSVHTFSGFLGFAAAPTVMSLLLAHGTWRQALFVVGAAGLATAVLLAFSGRLIADPVQPARRSQGATPATGVRALLLSPPLLIMFVFYVATALSSNGLQNFGNTSLIALYGMDVVTANGALAAFLWGTAIGVLAGGFLADAIKRFDTVVTACYLLGALLLVLVGAGSLGFLGIAASLFIAGFSMGAVMPARDIMVRNITPPGAIGKAFGFVSSGFGVSGVIGPVLFGTLMDLDLPALMLFVSAGLMIATIAVALVASWAARRSPAVQPAAG